MPARGAAHVVALLTRPDGSTAAELERIERWLIAPWLDRQKQGVGGRYRLSPVRYAGELARARSTTPAEDGPAVLAIAPPATRPRISNIEVNARILQQGALDGFAAAFAAFGRPPPTTPPPALCLDRLA